MKRIGIRIFYLTIFIVGLLFMSTVSGMTGSVSAETTRSTRSCNLLTNPDFSSGNVGWTTFGATIGGGQATLGPSYGGLEQSVDGAFASGSTTLIEADYSISGGLSGAKFQVNFVDSDGNSVTRNFQPSSASGTFSQSESNPAAGDPANSSYNGNTTSVRLYFEAHSGATMTVDEVRLTHGTCTDSGGGSGTVSADAPVIEASNISGVSGYNIGIFGSKFGSNSGSRSVTILGANAQIVEWTDTFIRATIPNVSPGNSNSGLVVTNNGGHSTTSPFTVYTIDPTWLGMPQGSVTNLSAGKSVTLNGYLIDDSWCWDGDNNAWIEGNTFITNFGCDYDFGAKFQADSGLGTQSTISVDLGSAQSSGEYLFQFFSKADWTQASAGECWRSSYPHDYVVEASASGNNGTWTSALATVSGNLRGNRSSYFTMPAGMRHVRMRVTDGLGDCNANITGRDFELKEVRVYKVNGTSNATVDSFSIYGDSLTTYAFNAHVGPADLSPRVDAGNPTNFAFSSFGFPGFKATNLDLDWDEPNELEDVYGEDALAASSHYWGIALGTNETNLSGTDDWGYYEPWSQFNTFDENVGNAILWLAARGHVPILARIPDTDEANNGYGFIQAKVKILNDIDTLAATHRLIPGPDMYTEFRLNVERDGASWFSGDGTHHSETGSDTWIDLWADSIQAARTMRSSSPTAVSVSGTNANVAWDGIAMLGMMFGVMVCIAFLHRER